MTHKSWILKRSSQVLAASPQVGAQQVVRIVAWQQELVTQLTFVLSRSKGTNLIQRLCAGHLAKVTVCWAQKLLRSKVTVLFKCFECPAERQGHPRTVENMGFESQARLLPVV